MARPKSHPRVAPAHNAATHAIRELIRSNEELIKFRRGLRRADVKSKTEPDRENLLALRDAELRREGYMRDYEDQWKQRHKAMTRKR